MNPRVIIACDSTCDLSPAMLERHHIPILPLGITLGDTLYADGVDMDPDGIFRHYAQTGALPKTSAINIGEFDDFFRTHTADGSAMVFFTISSELSSTYANARLAAQEYDNVWVVDTRNLSTGGGLLVDIAADMAASGHSAPEIYDACNALRDRVDVSFIVDNLEFLHKGGRCSALAAFGANLLQLKPCIQVHDGRMGVGKKYRGKLASALQKYIADRLGNGDGICKDRVFITHSGCDPEILQACVDQIRAIGCFREIHVTRAGCTISSHCGPNTLGILCLREP